MAEFRVQVVIDPTNAQRGAGRVRRELQTVERSANRVGNAIRQAFAFAGIGLGIGQLVQLADTFTNIQNRLRTVTDDTRQLANVTEDLFEISNRTRQSFESTAELYTRVSLASRDLGLTQREVLQFTESLNQAVILSGASAQEAEAGLIQLSQGLASGALRGDELRSVLEQLPAVADVIADGLGVTRGELRELGADGAITAGVVIDAFRQAEEELRTGFGETVPTIGQAFQVLRNNLIQLVGGFTDASGASQVFAQAILGIADNLETILRVATAAAIALGVQGFAGAVSFATRAVAALTVAIAANPIGAIVVGITAAVSLLIAFSDQIAATSDGAGTLADVFVATFELLRDGFDVLSVIVQGFYELLTLGAGPAFDEIDLSLEGILTTGASVIDGLRSVFFGGLSFISTLVQNVTAGIGNFFIDVFNDIQERFTSFVNTFISGFNQVAEFFGQGGIELFGGGTPLERFQGAGETAAQAFARGFNETSPLAVSAVEGFFDRVDEVTNRRLFGQDTGVGIGPDTAGLLPPGATARTGGGVGGGGSAAALREQNEELERLNDLLSEVTGGEADLLQRQQDLQTLFNSGAISLEQFTAAARDLNVEISALDNSFSGGIQNGIDRLIQRSNDLGSAVSDFVVGAFDSAADAIVEFARTGELNVREFFQDLFAQLLRLAANQLFSQLLGSLFGGGGGGGFFGGGGGGLGGLLGFQNGGSFMVGGSGGTDSQLVAFRATPNERVSVETPGQARQRDQGQPTIVQAPAPNVTVNVGGAQIASALNENGIGDDFVVNSLQRNQTTVRQIAGS